MPTVPPLSAGVTAIGGGGAPLDDAAFAGAVGSTVTASAASGAASVIVTAITLRGGVST
jgi:hypothetical protein